MPEEFLEYLGLVLIISKKALATLNLALCLRGQPAFASQTPENRRQKILANGVWG